MARLSDYVVQLQRSGYSNQMIRAHLARSGYSAEQISSAFSGSESKFQFFTRPVLFAILAVSIILSVLIYFVVFYSSLDVSLAVGAPSSSTVLQGGVLVFDKTISSSEQKVSVNVLYELVSASGSTVIKSEKLLISGASKSQSRITIPTNTVPGTYTLKVTINFAGKSKSQGFNFAVVASEKPVVSNKTENITVPAPQGCTTECYSPDPCVSGSCVGSSCVFTPKSPCCGNGKCESSEDSGSCSVDCAVVRQPREGVIASAESVVEKDSSKALLLCNSLIEDSPVDDCILSIASKSKSSVLCSSIRSVDKKDACFMGFAIEGDYSVCDKISDRYMSNSCAYLASAKEINAQPQ